MSLDWDGALAMYSWVVRRNNSVPWDCRPTISIFVCSWLEPITLTFYTDFCYLLCIIIQMLNPATQRKTEMNRPYKCVWWPYEDMDAVIFPTLMYKQATGPALTRGSHKDVYDQSEGHRGHLWPHYTESYFRRCWEEQPSWFVCPYSRVVYTLKNMLPPLKNTVFSSILCEFYTMGCFPWIVS